MTTTSPRSLRSRVLALASGTGIGQLAVIVVGPLLTRIYGPEVIGGYSQWFAFVAIAATFASLRWEYVFPSADPEHRPALLRVALLTVVMTSVAIAIVAAVMGTVVGGTSALWLAPAIALQVIYLVGFQWCLNVDRVGSGSRGKAVHGVGQAGAQVGFGLLAPTPLSLVLGYIASSAVGLAAMGSAWRTRGTATWRQIIAAVRRYWRTPLLVCFSGALNAIGVQLPILVIGMYDVALSGQFAIATRSATAPLVLVSVAISQVFLSEVAAGRRAQLAGSLVAVSRRAVPVLLALTIPLIGVGPQLSIVLLGAEWSPAGEILRVMAPALFMIAFSSMTSLIPIAIGHARGEAVYQVILLISRVAVLLALVPVSPMLAVGGYAVVTTLCLVGYSVWCFRLVGARVQAVVGQPGTQIVAIGLAVVLSASGWLMYAMVDASAWWSLLWAGAAASPLLAISLRKGVRR